MMSVWTVSDDRTKKTETEDWSPQSAFHSTAVRRKCHVALYSHIASTLHGPSGQLSINSTSNAPGLSFKVLELCTPS